VHMYANTKMIPVETVQELRWVDEREWWRG
jgi:hypothetical protein